MNKHSFLSRAKRTASSACKLILIIAAILSATIWTQAQSPVDLSLSSFMPTQPVTLGSGRDIEFDIPVFIENKREASGVIVTAELPAGVTFSSVKTDKGACIFADNRVTCNLGVVGREGAQAFDWVGFISIYVKPTQAGTVVLTAQITANEPDPNLSNNTVTLVATINPPKSRNKRVRFF